MESFSHTGGIGLSLIGILSKISAVLAEAQIGIFAVSTFHTDYIFVKSDHYNKALNTLAAKGYDLV